MPEVDSLSIEYKVHSAIVSHKTDIVWTWIDSKDISPASQALFAEQLVTNLDENAEMVAELLCGLTALNNPWNVLLYFNIILLTFYLAA